MFIHRFLVILAMATLTGPRTEERISPVLEELWRQFKHHFVGKIAYLGRKQEIARAREMGPFLRSCHKLSSKFSFSSLYSILLSVIVYFYDFKINFILIMEIFKSASAGVNVYVYALNAQYSNSRL